MFLARVLGVAVLAVAPVTAVSAATVTYDVVTDWSSYDLSPAKTGGLAGGSWALGDGAQLVSPGGSVVNLHRSPFDGSGAEDPATNVATLPYWAIGPNNPLGNADKKATLNFGSTLTGFSFVWGSVDTYNTIKFTGAGSDFIVDLALLNTLGGSAIPVGVGAISVMLKDFAFNSIVFTSDPSEALEVASFAAVPLPAGLPLLAVGIGALGFVGWRKKKSFSDSAIAA